MSRGDLIQEERLKKLNDLKKQNIDPYPSSFDVDSYSNTLQNKYKNLEKDKYTKDKVKIAGRLISSRDLGKIAFGVLQDGEGKIQVVLQDKETPEKIFSFFKKYLDSGDFIGVEGIIFRTQRGELSILVKKLELLSKSLLPLPEKWHGLKDDE